MSQVKMGGQGLANSCGHLNEFRQVKMPLLVMGFSYTSLHNNVTSVECVEVYNPLHACIAY